MNVFHSARHPEIIGIMVKSGGEARKPLPSPIKPGDSRKQPTSPTKLGGGKTPPLPPIKSASPNDANSAKKSMASGKPYEAGPKKPPPSPLPKPGAALRVQANSTNKTPSPLINQKTSGTQKSKSDSKKGSMRGGKVSEARAKFEKGPVSNGGGRVVTPPIGGERKSSLTSSSKETLETVITIDPTDSPNADPPTMNGDISRSGNEPTRTGNVASTNSEHIIEIPPGTPELEDPTKHPGSIPGSVQDLDETIQREESIKKPNPIINEPSSEKDNTKEDEKKDLKIDLSQVTSDEATEVSEVGGTPKLITSDEKTKAELGGKSPKTLRADNRNDDRESSASSSKSRSSATGPSSPRPEKKREGGNQDTNKNVTETSNPKTDKKSEKTVGSDKSESGSPNDKIDKVTTKTVTKKSEENKKVRKTSAEEKSKGNDSKSGQTTNKQNKVTSEKKEIEKEKDKPSDKDSKQSKSATKPSTKTDQKSTSANTASTTNKQSKPALKPNQQQQENSKSSPSTAKKIDDKKGEPTNKKQPAQVGDKKAEPINEKKEEVTLTPRLTAQEQWQKLRDNPHIIIQLDSPKGRKKRPGLSRHESLTVPGESLRRKDSQSPNSLRRGSSKSIDSRLSSIDYSKLAAAAAVEPDKEAEEAERRRKEEELMNGASDNYIKAAIPYLPVPLAVLLLLMNLCLPGTGTMLSGMCALCCGRSRIPSKDGGIVQTVCVNMWVGAAQLFTITFMLVGWVWSLCWGIYLVILAVEEQRQVKAHRQKELQAKALTALNSQIRPWTLRT